MIDVDLLIKLFKKNNINFFTGVPDSVLKELSYKLQKKDKKNHIIATNEGAAVSIGIGHYLSTNKIPVIYMQNSGLSNAINPLISIAHKKVYSIPLVLVIGWRGSPSSKDEPQHNVKGKITKKLLKLLNIQNIIIRSQSDLNKFDKQIKLAKKHKRIVACLIEKKILFSKKKIKLNKDHYNLNKELFIKTLLENIQKNTKIISSTGYNSRELMYLRKKYNFNNSDDFYLVGGMGHTASVALGFSLQRKNKTICLDGDGSLLMHLGSIKTAGTFANDNFKYVLLNNNSHDSVGGQKTYANNIDFQKLSKSFGFKKYYKISTKIDLKKNLNKFINSNHLSFLEVKVSNNKIKNLPRPKNLIKIRNLFMS